MVKYPYWFAVEEGKLIEFSDLAHLIAHALHPSDDEGLSYGAAWVNLDAELRDAVQTGELVVRNRSSMGRHTFPVGAALLDSVLMPDDLMAFLRGRGVEIRVTPYGSGPVNWTLDNAAMAIAEQEGWTGSARASFLDQMVEAANARLLVVRHPHTDLPINTGQIRTYYELTTPTDVNIWLESAQVAYRWHAPEELPQHTPIAHLCAATEPPDKVVIQALSCEQLAVESTRTRATACAERRSALDLNRERGTRRLILECWSTIERLHGSTADGTAVRRILKRTYENEKIGVLKTVQNTLISLRNAGLIP
jgi:hypothetical protein